jgi:uncharacterized protein (DUF488 family)
MEIYTIGFTQKNAAQFFQSLKKADVKRLIDVRLNNSSQLAAFTKKTDLEYFLREICGAEYLHLPILAPTQTMLDDYKKHKGSWNVYEERFLSLMKERQIETKVEKALFDIPCVLLCSEPTAEHCHRRLVLKYLQDVWPELQAVHL